MALKREQAVAALFDRLSNFPALTAQMITFSRAYKLPTEVPPEQQPALFLVATEYVMHNPSTGMAPFQLAHPHIHQIKCSIYIYATQVTEDTNPEGNLLNPIIDAVEDAIAFKPGVDAFDQRGVEHTNLGGLVERCSFDGRDPIMVVSGTGSLQATIIIPIEILIQAGRG